MPHGISCDVLEGAELGHENSSVSVSLNALKGGKMKDSGYEAGNTNHSMTSPGKLLSKPQITKGAKAHHHVAGAG